MTILEAIKKRHSVRNYKDKELPGDIVSKLREEIDLINRESGLGINLIINEPKAFKSFLAHYGKFEGVKNYIAFIGKNEPGLDEKIGYYGERIVLFAQTLGLNTCWVALTFNKRFVKNKCGVKSGEKLVCVLAVGYGATQGTNRKSKEINDVLENDKNAPDWIIKGTEAALLAPTAINQQKFKLSFDGNKVFLKSTGGFYSKVDLGIVKYHFEIGAGKENFIWG